jgi:DNA-binding NarL/FixJ family response regulator
VRILSVDDSEPWRRFIRLALLIDVGLQIIAEAYDGPEAIHKARELQPDLVLLDIGLPTLNGIETARQIREHLIHTKIVMVSENRSRDIAEEAFRAGACAYVVKSDAGSELLSAVKAALRGEKYVSTTLLGYGLTEIAADRHAASFSTPGSRPTGHQVGFYSDDEDLLAAITQFVGRALNIGNAAIVIATESHRDSLLARLQNYGVRIDSAVEQGRYITRDAAGALSTVMADSEIDDVHFFAVFDEVIRRAAEAATAGQCRVAIFGECVHLLWTQGNAEAAIKMESLGNQLANKYDLDILCAYSLKSFQGGIGSHVFERICAEHSAVHTW